MHTPTPTCSSPIREKGACLTIGVGLGSILQVFRVVSFAGDIKRQVSGRLSRVLARFPRQVNIVASSAFLILVIYFFCDLALRRFGTVGSSEITFWCAKCFLPGRFFMDDV